jgi:hypothetical protein
MPELNLAELRKIVYKTISDEVPSSEFNDENIGKIQLVEFGPSGAVQPFIVDIRTDFQLEHADGIATYSLSLETNERGQYLLKFINVQKTVNLTADPELKFNVTDGKIYLGAFNSAFKFISITATKEVKAGYLLNPVMLVLDERPLLGWTDIVYDPSDPEAVVFESIRARDKMTVEGDLRVEGNFVITESLVFDSTATYESIIINNLGNGSPLVVNKVDVNGTLLINDLFKLDALGNISILGNINLKESLVFDGSSVDSIKTTLSIVNPTANQTYQLPNKTTGTYTIATMSDVSNSTITLAPGNGIVIDTINNNNTFGLNQNSDKSITITHGATSLLNGPQGGPIMSGITVDSLGHVTAVGSTSILPVANGGTSFSTYVKGDILYSNNTDSLAKLAISTNNPSSKVLGIVDGAPGWIDVSTGLSLLTINGTETITNKLLQDSTVLFIDNDINTNKKMRFELFGISENTTITLTVPNDSGKIVLTNTGFSTSIGNVPTWLDTSGNKLGTGYTVETTLSNSTTALIRADTITAAVNLKANIASPSFTGTVNFTGTTVTGLDKNTVGLGNVDNTTDAGKPISSATQAALDTKSDKLLNINTLPDAGTTYTLDINDTSKIKVHSGTNNLTITIPDDNSSFPIGSEVAFIRRSTAGAITFSTTGVTLVTDTTKLKVKPNGSAVLLKIANDTWSLVGMLEA